MRRGVERPADVQPSRSVDRGGQRKHPGEEFAPPPSQDKVDTVVRGRPVSRENTRKTTEGSIASPAQLNDARDNANKSVEDAHAEKGVERTQRPPLAPRDDTIIHRYKDDKGMVMEVPDPYGWFEKQRPDRPVSPAIRIWTEAQTAATEASLNIPARSVIEALHSRLVDYESRPGLPFSVEGTTYFLRKTGQQDHPALYKENPGAEPSVVLDPNTLSRDGNVAVVSHTFSPDGKWLTYTTAANGDDWRQVYILDLVTGKLQDGELAQHCKVPSIAWFPDSTGVYYNRLADPHTVTHADERIPRLYLHKLGTSPSSDRPVADELVNRLIQEPRPDAKEIYFDPSIRVIKTNDNGQDRHYLLVPIQNGTYLSNRIYYRPLATDLAHETESRASWVPLLDKADAAYKFISNDGPVLYFQTDLNASRGRIIAIDMRQPGREHWHELLPERDDVITSAQMIGQRLVVVYENGRYGENQHDAHFLMVYQKGEGGQLARGENGELIEKRITLPALSSILEVRGDAGKNEIVLRTTSSLSPEVTYRYDFKTEDLTAVRKSESKFDSSSYETKVVEYPSKDGTLVPMYLTHKKGLKLDGSNPTLLYVYGGHGISTMPGDNFPGMEQAWLEMGGVYAVAKIRGGGDKGRDWYEAGVRKYKRNPIDDTHAAAEWLRDQGYGKSAIMGCSAGGYKVLAALQRPDLYQAVISFAPAVTDMLRYLELEGTYNPAWRSEYGDPKNDLKDVLAVSPLHNVQEGKDYPSVLIIAGETDTRVGTAHAYKFTATLQAAQKTSGEVNRTWLWVEPRGGHVRRRPAWMDNKHSVIMLTFLAKEFGLDPEKLAQRFVRYPK